LLDPGDDTANVRVIVPGGIVDGLIATWATIAVGCTRLHSQAKRFLDRTNSVFSVDDPTENGE
jgi:hypothetical protein